MRRMIYGLVILTALTGGTAYGMDYFTVMRVSSPMMVSGSVGLRLGAPQPNDLRPTLQVEAGVGGGRLALGLDNTGEANLGYGLKAAILRTWFEPIEVDEDQTFLGLEAELSIKRLILNVGGYRRVSDGDDNWLASFGLGFVF